MTRKVVFVVVANAEQFRTWAHDNLAGTYQIHADLAQAVPVDESLPTYRAAFDPLAGFTKGVEYSLEMPDDRLRAQQSNDFRHGLLACIEAGRNQFGDGARLLWLTPDTGAFRRKAFRAGFVITRADDGREFVEGAEITSRLPADGTYSAVQFGHAWLVKGRA